MKRLYYILLLISLLSFNTHANSKKTPSIFVFHINGVNTVITDALKNLNNLEAVSNIDSNIITWDLLYNSTHGLLASDLWDVMRMKKQEAKNLSVDDYVQTYMKTYHLNYPINSPEYKKKMI